MDNSTLALALFLIGVGLVLLVAELFVFTHGLLFVIGLVCIIIGVALPFLYGDSTTGSLVLLAALVLVPTEMVLMFYVWPRTPMARRLIQSGPEEDATIATMPVNLELEQLRGRFGRAVSPLRPSGVVDFDGRNIDVLTEGMMIEPGSWVRCIDVKAGRVIVRAVERPPDLSDLENADFT